MEIQPGDLVTPTRGRDAGRLMFVIGRSEDGRLHLADGNKRKISNPKRKKDKHVLALPRPGGTVAKRLSGGEPITNKELRHAIAELREKGGFHG